MIPTRNSDGTESKYVEWGKRVRSNDQHLATFYFCLALNTSIYLHRVQQFRATGGFSRRPTRLPSGG